jgi:hypothetical protein
MGAYRECEKRNCGAGPGNVAFHDDGDGLNSPTGSSTSRNTTEQPIVPARRQDLGDGDQVYSNHDSSRLLAVVRRK